MSPPPSDDLPLREIAQTVRYRIVRRVARGGTGAVYEARLPGAEGFEKRVAIKTILPDFAHDPEFRRLFVGEAKLVADLVHENIVQVYHLGIDGEMFFIAMEYVDGVNLDEFLARHAALGRSVPVEIAAFVASRICRGLEYAHAKRATDGTPLGIVHRDVATRNVLVNYEGVVKVGDFGIAKARLVMEQDENVLMGKFEYMSPEQTRGETTDGRSDLFAVGAILYELLVGKPLFAAGSLREVIVKVQAAFVPPSHAIREGLPEKLDAILRRALAPHPEDRFETAGEMGEALEHFLYHDRYGPTNQTLGRYMRSLFAPEPPR